MENFIVSARKYRPQTFDTVVGQNSITGTLKNAIRNNQLAQAFLFCGPRGVGKTTCARILARTINCEQLTPAIEACGICPSCHSFNDSASFNIYELDGASNNSVDDIRTLVEQVRIPPQTGKYKVYIIDEVHMLSAAAFNAFLKTLEEPPPYAKFILATTEKHKIIPTILSRCQIFDFKRITVDDIAGHLMHVATMEGVSAEEDALHVIAQKADGALRDALSIFDQLVSFAGHELRYATVLENLNVLDYDYYFRITDQVLVSDTSGALLTIHDIISKGFDGQHFLVGFGEHLRNLMVCKDSATAILLETAPSVRSRYVEQATRCPAPLLLELLDIGNRCDLSYKVSNNKRLHLEIALLQMCAVTRPAEARPGAAPAIAAPAPPPQPARIEPATTPAATMPGPPSPPPAPAAPPATATPPADPPAVAPASPAGAVRIRDIRSTFTSETSINNPPPRSGEGVAADDAAFADQADPFTVDELAGAWDEFAERLRSDAPHLYTVMKQYRPLIGEDWAIRFTLDNKVLDDQFSQKKTDLLEFLRRRFNNARIQLITTIADTQQNFKPYTDKEKFEQMAGRNPAVRNLKEELDLEIEY